MTDKDLLLNLGKVRRLVACFMTDKDLTVELRQSSKIGGLMYYR